MRHRLEGRVATGEPRPERAPSKLRRPGDSELLRLTKSTPPGGHVEHQDPRTTKAPEAFEARGLWFRRRRSRNRSFGGGLGFLGAAPGAIRLAPVQGRRRRCRGTRAQRAPLTGAGTVGIHPGSWPNLSAAKGGLLATWAPDAGPIRGDHRRLCRSPQGPERSDH